jgi:hypothetical protein
MIENERQYRLTKAQASRFSQTLQSLLQWLYEKFNFYELPFDLVAESLQRLRSRHL